MAAIPRCHKGESMIKAGHICDYIHVSCICIYIYTHIAICIQMHNLDIVIKTTQRCMWIWHNMTQEDLDNFGHVCWKNVDIFQAALLSSATKVSKELQEKIQASSLPYLGMVNPEIVMIYIHYTSIVRISVMEWPGMDDHRTYTMFYPSTDGFCSGKSWARPWHLPALYQCSIP